MSMRLMHTVRSPHPEQLALHAMMSTHTVDPHLSPDLVECIDQPRQIMHVLNSAADARRRVELVSPHLERGAESRLMGVDAENACLMLAMTSDDSLNRRLAAEKQVNLVIDHLGARALFTVSIAGATLFHQRACHVASIPDYILVGQTRSHVRIRLPESSDAKLQARFDHADRLEMRVLDISEGGLALLIPHRPLRGIRMLDDWKACRLDAKKCCISPLELLVRHTSNTVSGQQIGVSIESASASALQGLRRLVLQLQSSRRSVAAPPALTFSMR